MISIVCSAVAVAAVYSAKYGKKHAPSINTSSSSSESYSTTYKAKESIHTILYHSLFLRSLDYLQFFLFVAWNYSVFMNRATTICNITLHLSSRDVKPIFTRSLCIFLIVVIFRLRKEAYSNMCVTKTKLRIPPALLLSILIEVLPILLEVISMSVRLQ